jgi:purine-nucleoside phosphorylase
VPPRESFLLTNAATVNRHSQRSADQHAPPHPVHLAELATAYRDIKTQLITGAVDNEIDVNDLDMALQAASQSRRHLEQLAQAHEAYRELSSHLLGNNAANRAQLPQEASAELPLSGAGVS